MTKSNNDETIKVIEAHKGIIYKVANAYCKDDEDRKDLVQEITFQIWKSFHRYNDQYKISTWMYRIALNVAISLFRKNAIRQNNLSSINEDTINLTDDIQPDDAEEEINLLYQFIHELKELDRALMILYLEEKSHKEMADILGISPSNVATKISRIKLSLKEKFTTLKHNA